MAFYDFMPDDDGAIEVRDEVRDIRIPPLRRRSSSVARISQPGERVFYNRYPDDEVIALVEPKKKKRGLFGWLGCGDDDSRILSTRRVIEPQQLYYPDEPPFYWPHRYHHHHRHHPHYHEPEYHYHRDRIYYNYGDRYASDDYHHSHRYRYPHRHGRDRKHYWDVRWPLTDWDMRRRGERYKNSTESEWREELIDLMAERREEMAWERHHLEVMPEFEKTNFIYRDTQERNDRIFELTELLEQIRDAGLERDRPRHGEWEEV
jgi:hypothetical protein